MLRKYLLSIPDPAPGGGGAAAPPAPPAGSAPAGGGTDLQINDSFDKLFDEGGVEPGAGGGEPPKPAPAGGTPPAGTPPAGTPPKPAAGTPPAKPPDKPGAKPAEFDEEDGVQVPRFKSDKEFRGWGLNGYKKANTLQKELDGLRTKVTDLERRPPANDAERQQLSTRLAALEKQVEEKEQQIRFVNYERSQEYLDKYQTPYHNAIRTAHADVSELLVSEPDTTQAPVDGKYPTKERQATQADFDEIYQLPLGPATKLAKEKFGDAASIVIQHRATIKNLAKSAVNALDQWKKDSTTRQEQEKTQSTARRAQIDSFWGHVNEKLSADPRAKEMWGPADNDKEIDDALQKGFSMVDQRFSEAYDKMPLQDQIILDAHIRHRVAGFYRRGIMLTRLQAELATAKERLKGFEGSDPGKPAGSGDAPAGGEDESPTEMFEKKL